MGLTCSPDICQELMENIFRDIEDSDVFIDDIGVFSKCWKITPQTLTQNSNSITRLWFYC